MENFSLSEKASRRISIWILSLRKACDYLVVCEAVSKRFVLVSEPEFGTYNVGDEKISYIESFVIEKGLSEAALIGLCRVLHGSGNEGKDVAGDSDKEVARIRDEMKKKAAEKLNYKDVKEFEDYLLSLRVIRDGFIAHYDGSKADYAEITPNIGSMKMSSAHFSLDEIMKIKDTTFALFTSLRGALIGNQ